MNIVVLISGSGSNLQAILDRFQGDNTITVKAVVSNRPDAYGLIRAQQAGVASQVVDHQAFAHRAEFERALLAAIKPYEPDLIVLAGFMRILSSEFVAHYPNKIINIHPSLLPKYPGLNTHERVLAAGDRHHGVTVHVVNEALDAGPILGQASLEVAPDDTPLTLAKKVQALEHQLYPDVIASLADEGFSVS